ncbi:alpha/beta fold hydrolase [Paraburkholderia unamae]|uniref:Alpha/beta hydrolase family protein n=1 Tax=Paraburkholderia unamae TaxID=219649 RepID=A0ABX5KTN9_9BURK|nr:alpha/beta fold hydrolase [Paraburkholderia unamae]PVX85051.1 alpha/beta hydrolase family protein [Paraburkholderia unamae]RAR65857.1 alpha/beta hydrolase family protein [Paraburkholderia unamae]CAG9275140.1 Alpha/beta hydrolase [Paraburkholderia unamae]
MSTPEQLLFLPGASGNKAFWQPLSERLATRAAREFVGYPGFGGEPADPAVASIDDIVRRVVARIDRPTALVAQSMGGVIAVRAALDKPQLVTHLVLTVTSGGIDTAALGAQNWRAGDTSAFPSWFVSYHADLSDDIARLTQPALLLWGDSDPLSPLAVGERLNALLGNATLHVVRGGEHDLGSVHAEALAPLVDAHLLAR